MKFQKEGSRTIPSFIEHCTHTYIEVILNICTTVSSASRATTKEGKSPSSVFPSEEQKRPPTLQLFVQNIKDKMEMMVGFSDIWTFKFKDETSN